MANYIQITFQPVTLHQSELLVAELSNIGFEGFEEGEDFLRACIPEHELDESVLKTLAGKNGLPYQQSTIEETNWNAVWESNFEPVIVDTFAAIRAEFHKPIPGVEHEIIITPKMSFGTGHHATTLLMIREMSRIDFIGKTVFDFGTGTGILAILAERLGALKIIAADNDEWSITNAIENAEKNAATKIEIKKMDHISSDLQFDVILANINKNVIVENFAQLVAQLIPGGCLLVSGLLVKDETDILTHARRFPLVFDGKTTENNWIALKFTR